MSDTNDDYGIPLPLRRCFIYETDDLLATRDHLAKFLGHHNITPLEKHYRVRFRHCGINLGRIGLNTLYYGAAIRIGVRPPANTFLLLVLLRGSGTVRQAGSSISLNAGDAYVFNPGVPAVLDLSQDMINFTINLSRPALTDFLERESGRSLMSELVFRTWQPGISFNANGIRNILGHVCNEINEGHTQLQLPVLEKQYEQTVHAQILAELPHNHSEMMGLEPLESAPGYIRRVEDYIAEHYAEQIQLSEMADCAAIGVRTLQNGFRRFRNTTPMEYLRDYRLNMSRQRLEDGRYADMNISEIATSCGFGHLSKFAKCYRQRFGESPSTTRKKTSGV